MIDPALLLSDVGADNKNPIKHRRRRMARGGARGGGQDGNGCLEEVKGGSYSVCRASLIPTTSCFFHHAVFNLAPFSSATQYPLRGAPI